MEDHIVTFKIGFVVIVKCAEGLPCDTLGCGHPAIWSVYTSYDTGDGNRLACHNDLASWVEAVYDRIS